jgi:diguanylate cyclase (GGDEF)-like protein
MRVLIVEDDPVQRLTLSTQLNRYPEGASAVASGEIPRFDLKTAGTLADAVSEIEAFSPEVVLLDLNLPDSGGLETLSKLREVAPNVAVVVLTGHDDEGTALAAISRGAQDYLVKGTANPDVVVRALRYATKRNGLLHALSLYDDLTGLHNRRGFTALVEQQIKLAARKRCPCLLFYFDFDHLKEINDTYGHAVGSEMLCALASALKETFRTSDILARLGGDEFVAFSIDVDAGNASKIAGRLFDEIDKINSNISNDYSLSVSVGVAEVRACCNGSVQRAIMRADQAMYYEKRRRREKSDQEERGHCSYSIAPLLDCPHTPINEQGS